MSGREVAKITPMLCKSPALLQMAISETSKVLFSIKLNKAGNYS